MSKELGKILCSGPMNVSIDNLASRVDQVTTRVVDRYNKDKSSDDPARAKYSFVLRSFKPAHEATAFVNLLQNPHDKEHAVPVGHWIAGLKWTLHLSGAFWLLMLFRANVPGVRELRFDDSFELFQLKKHIDEQSEFALLRDLATGKISW